MPDLAGLLARAARHGGPAEDAALEGAAVVRALAGARHGWRAWAGAPAALGLLAALTRAAVAAGGTSPYIIIVGQGTDANRDRSMDD